MAWTCDYCGDSNCQWEVTKDNAIQPEDNLPTRKGWRHRFYLPEVPMPFHWRTCSDDGPEEGITYYGVSSTECVAPLYDLGMPDCGDTIIQYRRENGVDKHGKTRYEWETIN